MAGIARALFVQHQDDCPPGHVGDRLAQLGVTVDVVRAQERSLPEPSEFDMIVPLGSDDSAYDDSLPYLAREYELLSGAVHAGVPVFGICFGAQLLARALGGGVARAPGGPEIGWLTVDSSDPNLIEPGPWLVWHLDVMTPPPGSTEIARTAVGTQAFVHGRHLGVQFHPEATSDSARTWAEHYRSELSAAGVDHATLVGETRSREQVATQRAYRLTDRVVGRTRLMARS